MEVLKDLLKEHDPMILSNALTFLQDLKATNVGGLLEYLKVEPTADDLQILGLKQPRAWLILKASVEARIGKKSNTMILLKRA